MRLFDVEDRGALPPPIVRVNGKEIAGADIAQEVQNHPADSPVEAREAAARALVVRELLLQAASRRGLVALPADLGEGKFETTDDALIRALLDDAVKLPSPTSAECRRYYEANVRRFRSPTIWEPAHILLSVVSAQGPARDAARNKACALIELLEEHPEQFEQLARDHSQCPSREQGGNLGQISPGQTTPAFEAALESMKPGTLSSEPVETPYGFHVIRLDRCIAGETLPFASVEKKISDYLADAVFHRAIRQFVSLLASEARIEGIGFEQAHSPLVQ